MFNNQNNFQRPQNQDMGGFRPNNRKIANPQNFKIVKCKNFERGKILINHAFSPLILLAIVFYRYFLFFISKQIFFLFIN